MSQSYNPFTRTREDYLSDLLREAEGILRDDNYPETNFDRAWVEDQAKALVFGDDFEKHSIDDAIAVRVCDSVGHYKIETFQSARNIEDTLKVRRIRYRRDEDDGFIITCPRCLREYKL